MEKVLLFSSCRSGRGAAGFTMIELLIAIVVLLVGIVAVAQLVPASITSNFRNRSDSTALIAAQRQLEQMVRQRLTAVGASCLGGALLPAGHYSFCDRENAPIALGQINAAAGLATTEDGCPLVAGTAQLDFTQPAGNCDAGYTVTKQWAWDPNTGATRNIQLRWRVITWHNGGTPVRKVLIVGARAGSAGESFVVTNLQTVVGR